MALTDHNILITPYVGDVNDPKIEFNGANASIAAQTITLTAYPTNGGTITFSGSSGQIASISNNSAGTRFNVVDAASNTALRVNSDGTVILTETTGNVGIGTLTPRADLHVQGDSLITGRVGIGTSNIITMSSNILSVYGTAMVYGNIDLISSTNGTSGIYFTDGSYQTSAAGSSTPYSNTNVANYLSGPVQIGNLTINNTTASTSTLTGALLMGGGAGIQGAVHIGGLLYGASTLNIAGAAQVNSLISNSSIAGTTGTFSSSLYSAILNTAGTATVNTLVSNVYGLFGQNVTVNSTNASITTGTGALVVAGGAGIGGNINVGGLNSLFTNFVGIGTSTVLGSRGNVFSVYGNANHYGNLVIGNATAGSTGIYFPDGTFQTTASSASGLVGGVNQSVQFNDGGVFGGQNNFLFDKVNTRLGIGTTSVTNGLTVFSATAALFNTTNGTDQQILVTNTAAYGTILGFNSSSGTGVNTYGYLSIAGAAAKNIAITKTGTGIGGVTIPQNILEIGGTTIIGLTYSGNNSFINPPSNGLAVQGSVGVGTFTPLSTLDVSGIISARTAFSTAGTAFVNAVISNTNITTATLNSTGALLAASINSNTNVVGVNLQSTGQATVASLVSNGAVSGTTGTFTGSLFGATLNSSGAAIVASLNSNTNVVGVNLQSTGQSTVASLVANANIFGATLNTSGAAQHAGIISNTTIQSIGTLTAQAIVSNTSVAAASATITNNLFSGTLNVNGALQAGSIVSNGAISGTTGTFTGAIFGSALNTSGTATVNALVSNTDVKTATVNASSTIVGANIYSNGFVQAAGTVIAQAIQSNTTITAGTGLTVTSGGLTVTGTSSFNGNVNINGNINITGSITSTNSNILVVQSPLIYVGEDNPADLYDLGIVGSYTEGSYFHTGLVRNHVTNYWTIFDKLTGEPNVITGNINWSDSTIVYGPFAAGNLLVVGNTASTGTTTGAIVINGTGGIGLGGRLNVGGSAWFAGTVNAGGTAIVNALVSNGAISGTTATVTALTATSIQNSGTTLVQSLNSNTNVVATNLQSTGAASVASLVSNGAVSGTSGTFTGSLFGGTVNSAGAAIVASLNSNTNVVATNIQSTGQATVASLVSNGAVSGTTGTFTGSLFGGTVNSAGAAIVASLNSNTNVVATNLQSTGATTVASLNSNTNVVATNIQSTGQATVASLVSNGAVSGTTGTFTGALFSGSFNTSGSANVAGLTSNTTIYTTSGYSGLGVGTTAGSVVTYTIQQGGRPFISVDFNNYINLYQTIFANTTTSSNVAVGMTGNAYWFGMGAGDVATRGFDLVGTSSNQLWYRERTSGVWNQVLISGGTIFGSALNISGTATVNALVSNVYGVFGQNVTVNSTNASTTTGTGALVVAGGAGVGGNINVGGSNSLFTNKVGIGTSTVLGARGNVLSIYGSADIYGNIELNTSTGTSGIYFTDGTYLTTAATPGSYSNANVASYLSGPVLVGNLYVGNSTASTSTTTGAIITNGGVGIAGNVNTGGSVNTFTGNVGIGTNIIGPGYRLQVVGAFAATTKSFVINHPLKPGMFLRYGSLEGPENGVYVRGRLTGKTEIALPDYWSALVDDATITVNLTPIGNSKIPRVKCVENNIVYLKKPLLGSIDCYFVVFGERKDVDKLDVEI